MPMEPDHGERANHDSIVPPTYAPNALLRWLYRRFFDAIEVDPAWVDAVRQASRRGTVVYALRNLSFLDFLALDHLTKRFGLPQVRFANDLGLWILEPFGKGWGAALRPRTRDDALAELRATIEAGASATLFLKRPPTLLAGASATGRGLLEGDLFVRELIELQRERTRARDLRPIVIVPQVFVWSKRPDVRQRSIVDAILGTHEWPGAIRTTAQFLRNYRDVMIRSGEPLDLAEYLRREGDHPIEEAAPPRRLPGAFAAGDPRDDVTIRRAIYVLLRRLERERRVIVGPVVKPSDRLIDEIVRTPRMRTVIAELSGEGEGERVVVEARARAMLREMAASVEPDVIAFMDHAMRQIFSRIYDGLDVDREGLERVRQAAREGTVVLLPSHKSHIDYLFVSWVLYTHGMQVPLIAAGDNLAFFPLGLLFRRAGAFFIRRKIAGDRLYAAALDAYVNKLVHDGYPLEFFLEGGRSRTGKVMPPKLGLLAMVVDAAYEQPTQKVAFVPISIGYERLVEAKSYVRELSGGEKEGESVAGLLRALQVLAERYGRLNFQVGEIVTIDAITRDVTRERSSAADRTRGPSSERAAPFVPKRAIVARLGHQVMYEINRVTAVTGGSLVAMALLVSGARAVPRGQLLDTCRRLLATLDRLGARMQRGMRREDGGIAHAALDEALALYSSAGWLDVVEDEMPVDGDRRKKLRPRSPTHDSDASRDPTREPLYVVPDDRRLSVDISKNVIVHFFVPYALVATGLAMDARRGEGVAVRLLRERVKGLSRLLKYEFMFRADATFDDIFDDTLAALVEEQTIVRTRGETGGFEDDVIHVPTSEGGEPRARIDLYAGTIASFLEGYRVAARSLSLLTKGTMTAKELSRKALAIGKRMHLAGEITRREAVCRPVLENAILAFGDQGYVRREEQKLVLTPSFDTMSAVTAVERRIAGYLRDESAS